MALSPGQAHNVEEAESKGHCLVQFASEKFHCERCGLWAYVTETVAGVVFQEPCGALFSGDREHEGVLAV
jgi:hypothetical protein